MQPDALEQILDWIRSRHFGKYRGVVVDNSDPSQKGRILVRVPAVLGPLEVWAMPCVPYAGDAVGFFCLPDPGAGVWVEFEGGDPSFPIWAGCFWADGEAPESIPTTKAWKTEAHTVRLDDGAGEMTLQNKLEAIVTLGPEVTAEAGLSKLAVGALGVVSEQGPKKVEVTAASVRVNNGVLEIP
ncbi:MAG: phage baseplate assembly protein V [Myxococcota bacterium]